MSKTRARLYERINFLPFADAMFSGVAILIIILVSLSQRSSETVSHPQADIILRCEPGAALGSYSAVIVEAAGSIPGFRAGRAIEDGRIRREIENWLGQWPELSARILLQEYTGNRFCADALKDDLETLHNRLAAEGRAGKAIPLISVAYAAGSLTRNGQVR